MSGGYKNLAGRVGSGREVFEISRNRAGRVEWGRVGRCLKSHGTGRVGSSQEVFKSPGSGQVTYPDSI